MFQGLSQRQEAWGWEARHPPACWWCQLWGRQTAPFRPCWTPLLCLTWAGGCPELGRTGGAAPDGPSSSRKPMFSSRPYGVWDAWGWWAHCFILGLVLREGTPEGSSASLPPRPAPLTSTSHPLNTCSLKSSHPNEDSAHHQMPQHPKSPWAPLPLLHCHSSLRSLWLLNSSGTHPPLCIPAALSSLIAMPLPTCPQHPACTPNIQKSPDWSGLSVVKCFYNFNSESKWFRILCHTN